VNGRKPDHKLSQEPKQIRNRLRRKHAKFATDLDTYQDVAYGKRIEDWDIQELAKGRPRNKNGTFSGQSPKWITAAVVREAKRRLMEETFGTLAGHMDLAIATVVKLLKSKEVDDWGKPIVDARTKLAAATFIIENILGKPKALVEVDASDTVKQFLAAALVMDDGQPAHPVIDGQFTEEEEDDDDDPDE